MLFGYYLLAKIEERECLEKFGESYKKYLNKSYMFLPIKKPKFLRKDKKIKKSVSIMSGIVLYFIVIILSIKTADLVKIYSIESLYGIVNKN